MAKNETHSAVAAFERAASPLRYTADVEQGTFSGIASMYGSVANGQRGPTRFSKGAFAETLQRSGGKIPLLWQHDPARPVGVIHKLAEGNEGLLLDGKITTNSFGDDILALMRDGAITGLSIGFDAVTAGYEKQSDGAQVRVVSKANLHEVSLVTFPADSQARVRTVHSASMSQVFDRLADVKWSDAQREALADVFAALFKEDHEDHAGRMFSTVNLELLKDAWSALTDLLAKGDPGFLSDAMAFLAAEGEEPEPDAVIYPGTLASARVFEIRRAIREAEIDALTMGIEVAGSPDQARDHGKFAAMGGKHKPVAADDAPEDEEDEEEEPVADGSARAARQADKAAQADEDAKAQAARKAQRAHRAAKGAAKAAAGNHPPAVGAYHRMKANEPHFSVLQSVREAIRAAESAPVKE